MRKRMDDLYRFGSDIMNICDELDACELPQTVKVCGFC